MTTQNTTKAHSTLSDVDIKAKMNPDVNAWASVTDESPKLATYVLLHSMRHNDMPLHIAANLDYSQFAFAMGEGDETTTGSFNNLAKNGKPYSCDKLTKIFGIPKQAVIGGIESRAKLGIVCATMNEDGEYVMTGEDICIFLITKNSKVGAPAANIAVIELLKGMTVFDVQRLLNNAYENDTANMGDKTYKVYARQEWRDELKARKKAKAKVDKRAAKNAQGANVQ